ncbi:MAG: XRE family transcriptional regulator [Alphaproteobacteria bacterium]|nr:XRE family transcriptional regulator [Alphaproteobacteria bacterium]
MARRDRKRGTDNVLLDLGFADAQDLAAKALLAKKINDLIARRGLTQAEAAAILAMPQPKVSAIHNYKLRGLSLERLMRALTALGQRVEIVIRPTNRPASAGITVAA